MTKSKAYLDLGYTPKQQIKFSFINFESEFNALDFNEQQAIKELSYKLHGPYSDLPMSRYIAFKNWLEQKREN